MKNLILLLLVCSTPVWAQIDLLQSTSADTLKPIGSDLIPGYGRYNQVRTRYTYDGIDIRHAKDLGPYIMASGDPMAIREFQSYISSRHTGGWLIAGGIATAIVGGVVMSSNAPGSNGFYTTQYFQCPTGQYCGTPVGGTYPTIQVPDVQRKHAFNTGSALLLSGSLLAGIGWGLCMPGPHIRRSVQYYNRALKQRGISWQMTPYSSLNSSGVGLLGKF
ncbi:hypothetical protein WBJ53_01220 [Spirosoma sp. SC4-14]|uniref:hypothetical protein n=1 Tax=Spirosoma sp. SC4-14 TaxID=3128900 RepID=UPI0030D2EB6F